MFNQELAEDMLDVLRELALSSSSDSVRYQAARYLLDLTLDRVGGATEKQVDRDGMLRKFISEILHSDKSGQ